MNSGDVWLCVVGGEEEGEGLGVWVCMKGGLAVAPSRASAMRDGPK